MKKIKFIVCGAAGRMGTRIMDLALNDPEIESVAGIERKCHPSINAERKIYDDFGKIIHSFDVVIDFTDPSATLEHLDIAEKNKKCMVIGTTGFKDDEIKKIQAKSKNIPIVFSPNMSIGINVLFKLVSEVAKVVPNYDMEIVELHHNQKKDAPSGTAVKLAQIIAESLNRDIKDVGVYGRQGVIGPRKKEEIGVLAVRAGDIVGDHTVYFAGAGERIELTHRAHSRDTLASGAIVAAKWLVKQNPGLYNMQDVLGIKNN